METGKDENEDFPFESIVPDEILARIFLFLENEFDHRRGFGNIARVCHRWYKICQDIVKWKHKNEKRSRLLKAYSFRTLSHPTFNPSNISENDGYENEIDQTQHVKHELESHQTVAGHNYSLAYTNESEETPLNESISDSGNAYVEENENKINSNTTAQQKSEPKGTSFVHSNVTQTEVRVFPKLSNSSSRLNVEEQHLIAVQNSRKWNEQFQMILEEEDTLQKYTKLKTLSRDFVYAASNYAKIIISELCLPFDAKSIKPQPVGGLAGGDKFICQGILFKFSLDCQISLPEKPPVWMYGGDQPMDENAIKVGGHEIRGLESFASTATPGLHFPLMAIIDYKGFRIIAESLVPISKSTIVYGSDNSGQTVHADDPKLNIKMKKAAKKLNLKAHFAGTGSQVVRIHTPGDIEGHIGFDGRYYVIDFARLFPPEAPRQTPGRSLAEKRMIFYKLLRPELVRSFAVPLSSDAFSAWGEHDDLCEVFKHKREVRDATTYLKQTVIPQFAKKLEQLDKSVLNTNITRSQPQSMMDELRYRSTFSQDADIDSYKDKVSMSSVHRMGINFRHLGLIRKHLASIPLRKLILGEMIARTLKCLLRHLMREKMREVRIPSIEPFKQVAVDLFSVVLGMNDAAESFWKVEVKAKLLSKFREALTSEEEAESFDLRERLDIYHVFDRLQDMSGIYVTREFQSEWKRKLGTEVNVDEIRVKVSHLTLVDYAEGMVALMKAKTKKGEEAEALLHTAISKFETASTSDTNNANHLLQWGNALCALAKLATSTYRTDELYKSAFQRYKTAVDVSPSFCVAYVQWGMALMQHSKSKVDEKRRKVLQKAGKCFQAGLAIDSECMDSIIAQGLEEQKSKLEQLLSVSLYCPPLHAKIATALSNLKVLDLSNCQPISGKALATACNPNILELVLTNCYLDEDARIAVQTKCTNLQRLNVSKSKIRDMDVSALCEHCKNIISLDLSLCMDITDASIKCISENLPNITCLALQACGSLTENCWPFLAKCTNLEVLNISKLNLDTIQFKELAKHCPKLRDLDLSYCQNFESRNLIALADHCPNLQRLELSRLSIENDDLCYLASGCKKLEVLGLYYSGRDLLDSGIQAIAENCTTMQKLNLYRCHQITDASLKYLSQYCTKLYSLDLSYCGNISDVGIHFLADLELRSLSLQGCQRITDNSIRVLTTKCTMLTKLNLSQTVITDNGIANKDSIRSLNLSVRSSPMRREPSDSDASKSPLDPLPKNLRERAYSSPQNVRPSPL